MVASLDANSLGLISRRLLIFPDFWIMNHSHSVLTKTRHMTSKPVQTLRHRGNLAAIEFKHTDTKTGLVNKSFTIHNYQ